MLNLENETCIFHDVVYLFHLISTEVYFTVPEPVQSDHIYLCPYHSPSDAWLMTIHLRCENTELPPARDTHWAGRHSPWLWENSFLEGSRVKGNELWSEATICKIAVDNFPGSTVWVPLEVTRSLGQDHGLAGSTHWDRGSFKATAPVRVSPPLSLFPHWSGDLGPTSHGISVLGCLLATHHFSRFNLSPPPALPI